MIINKMQNASILKNNLHDFLLLISTGLPFPVWISGHSSKGQKWTFYNSKIEIPIPTGDTLQQFPPWICTQRPTGNKPVSVASWGFGWRIYEGLAAQKYFMCTRPSKTTTAEISTTTTATTPQISTASTTSPTISTTISTGTESTSTSHIISTTPTTPRTATESEIPTETTTRKANITITPPRPVSSPPTSTTESTSSITTGAY